MSTPSPRRIAVVIPFEPGSRDAVLAILAKGASFDPEAISGLDRYEVFLTPEEAVFVFDSEVRPDELAGLLAEPRFWGAVDMAGPPRVGAAQYSWARRALFDDVSFLPTPGPGDSEGGDIY
jgi:hypothetical protein